MEQRIQQVTDKLQIKWDYEQKHKHELNDEERMLAITRETAQFYNLLLKEMRVTRILEIGLSVGYSTLWFADAILSNTYTKSQRKNAIISLEKDNNKITIASENLKEAGVSDIVDIRKGDAVNSLSQLTDQIYGKNRRTKNTKVVHRQFDFIFNDADKENSIKYFDMCLPLLRKGGIIATDNIIDTPEMKDFPIHVRKNPHVESLTLPIGWGQEITMKIT